MKRKGFMNFKVGDKVRITDNRKFNTKLSVGDEGIITRIYPISGTIMLKFGYKEVHTQTTYTHWNNIELIRPKFELPEELFEIGE